MVDIQAYIQIGKQTNGKSDIHADKHEDIHTDI